MKKLALLLLPLMALCSCHNDEDEIVASVYGHKLYYTDIANVVPQGVSGDDSIAILTNYVNQWVDQMILVYKAEKNINEDFSEQLANYRNSLITYAYQQQIINQNIDTVIADSEVRQYYNEHHDDFVLTSPIARVIYVKMPLNDDNLKQMEHLMSAKAIDDDEMLSIQRIAGRSAIEMSFDFEKWIPIVDLLGRVPAEEINSVPSQSGEHCTRLADTASISLVRFLEVRNINDFAPIEVEFENIKTIILNRRKQELIKRMRQDLRREADKNGKVTINI